MLNRKGKKSSSYIVAIVLLLLVGISVGYAAISATLNITGTSNIGKATWDVHFANLNVLDGSVRATSAAKISSEDTTSVSYEVSLNAPGDFYSFTVDVVNTGTINAKVSEFTLSGLTEDDDRYLNYTVKYANGSSVKASDSLNAGGSATLLVKIEFEDELDPADLPEDEKSLNLGFAINYVQK